MSKAITAAQLGSAISAVKAYILAAVKNVSASIAKKVDDAPSDGKNYVRKDGAWVEAEAGATIEYATDDEVNEAINKILGE